MAAAAAGWVDVVLDEDLAADPARIMPRAAAGKKLKLRVREAASMGPVKRDVCAKVHIHPQWLELCHPEGTAVADDVTPWDLRMRGTAWSSTATRPPPFSLNPAKDVDTPLTTVVLLVGPDRTPVPALEVLLSDRSATFRDMFSTLGFPKGATAKVALPNWQPSTIRLLLKDIYSDQVDLSEQDDEAVVALMAAAGEFKLEKLRVACESFLVARVHCSLLAPPSSLLPRLLPVSPSSTSHLCNLPLCPYPTPPLFTPST
eukprot:SM000114S24115  [mRNA]  locus=s114:69351:70542:+ [translate_table: standard]